MPSRSTVATLLLLVAICVGVLDTHCDELSLTRPARSEVAPARPDADDDCGSVCVPDCYSCTRSDQPRAVTLAPGDQNVVAAFVKPAPRPTDGVLSPPYHPPLLHL